MPVVFKDMGIWEPSCSASERWAGAAILGTILEVQRLSTEIKYSLAH